MHRGVGGGGFVRLDVEASVGSSTLLTLRGRLDMAAAADLLTTLADCWSCGARSIVCDLGPMEVPDPVRLLTVFPAALHRAGGWPERDLRLVAASPAMSATIPTGQPACALLTALLTALPAAVPTPSCRAGSAAAPPTSCSAR